MAALSPDPKTETGVDTGARTNTGAIRAPLWVRVFGAFSALFFAAFVVLHLFGGGLRHHSLPDVNSNRAPPDRAEVRSADDARRAPAQP